LRDGINCYIDMLIKDKYIKTIALNYGIITTDQLDIITKRYDRINKIKPPIIINNDKIIYFSEKNKTTQTFEEIDHYFEWGDRKTVIKAPFSSITNQECKILWNAIKMSEKYTFDSGYAGRDEWRHKTWKYNISNTDMDKLENLYYRYLMGYID